MIHQGIFRDAKTPYLSCVQKLQETKLLDVTNNIESYNVLPKSPYVRGGTTLQ